MSTMYNQEFCQVSGTMRNRTIHKARLWVMYFGVVPSVGVLQRILEVVKHYFGDYLILYIYYIECVYNINQ